MCICLAYNVQMGLRVTGSRHGLGRSRPRR